MSRLLLLLIFLAWATWSSQTPPSVSPPPAAHHPLAASIPVRGIIDFLAGYLLLVAIMGIWSRWVARHADSVRSNRAIRRFQLAMGAARLAIPAWFFVGLYALGWGPLMDHFLRRIGLSPSRVVTPGLLLSTLPAFFAWTGLWWSQYPTDVSVREQALLAQLDEGMPIHPPPSLATYIGVNLRLQLFFTLVPVILLFCLHDVASTILHRLTLNEVDSDVIELLISLSTAAIVFVTAPAILKRVLHTEPMPDGPLRRRLEDICRRHNVGYQDILLWRTANHMGNAAVMGIIPRFRYILMSDLLLETMTDEQIEAVFAHEIGHVIHRHLLWFAAFFVTVTFAAVSLSDPIDAAIEHWLPRSEWFAAAMTLWGGLLLLLTFLFLSRKFERQADVFAARVIQAEMESVPAPVPFTGQAEQPMLPAPPTLAPADRGYHVGLYGATAFSSALRQVARINNIPLNAISWCHGSIAKRIGYLHDLSADSSRTARFDRFMIRLYAVLMLALVGFGVWAAVTLYLSRATL